MPQTIQVYGGDLYSLAAQYLGDATQWTRIAAQNNLSDPVLAPVEQSLVIPDPDLTKTGGVPTQ